VWITEPAGDTKEQRRTRRAELTKQAIADVVRLRLFERRFQQTTVARESGISRTHFRTAVLNAKKEISIFIFLEMSQALGFDNPGQLLRQVLDRRDQRARDEEAPQVEGVVKK